MFCEVHVYIDLSYMCCVFGEVEQTADTQLIGKRTQRPSDVQDPVIVWWSPVSGEQGRVADCGRNRCVFTTNRSHHSHPQTRAFLFYGESTDITLV